MAKSFDELEIWQRASDLAVRAHRLTATFPKNEQFELANQLRRSAISVAANIAEAHGRFHYGDLRRFLYVARGSIYETRSHLILAERLGYIGSNEVREIHEGYLQLTKMIHGFIRSQNGPPANSPIR